MRSPAAGLEHPEHRDGEWHGGGLVALADQVQDPVAAQGLGVVLDPDRGGLGGAQGVDAEQVGQGAVVDGDGLGDLEEPDQLEPVQALGAGLVGVDLGQPCVDGGVGGDQPVDVGEPEEPPDGVHRGVDRGGHQPGLAEVADVELDVRALDPDQRVQGVGLAPAEPAAELVGVQGVGVPGVPGQVGHRGELGRGHRVGLERKKRRAVMVHLARETSLATDRHTRGEALARR